MMLVTGTLQATHIHKVWNAPTGPLSALRAHSGNEAPCVYCVSSHAATDLPLHYSSDQVESSAIAHLPEVAVSFSAEYFGSHTIRPPPTA